MAKREWLGFLILLLIVFVCYGRCEERDFYYPRIIPGEDRSNEFQANKIAPTGEVLHFFATATTLFEGYAITAKHAVKDSKDMKVNGAAIVILMQGANDQMRNDYAVIKARVFHTKTIVFRTPSVGDIVYATGWALGSKMTFVGRVAKVEDEAIVLDMNTPGGISGAGIFDKDGYCVGMVVKKVTDGMGSIIGVAIHPNILQRVLNQLQTSLNFMEAQRDPFSH